MMKVIITGSSGFVGARLVSTLLEHKYHVLGIDLQPPKDLYQPLFSFHQCDILDLERLIQIVSNYQPDAVVHLAARTDLDEEKNINGYAANFTGVKNLIAAIKNTPSVKRCIFTSSQLVCRLGYVPMHEQDYCPHTLYGQSKVMTEEIVRQQDGGDVIWCLVRPTTVWGAGMQPHYQRFFRMIQQGRYFHVGKKPLYKTYGFIGNVVYQYLKFLEVNPLDIHRKTFYIADYEPISLREWTNAFQRQFNAKSIPTYPENLAKSLAFIGDAINYFGFKQFPFNTFRLSNVLTEYQFDLSETKHICGSLPFTMMDGVEETANWFRNLVD